MAKAYRPKGDSILYALVEILQDPILFSSDAPPLQNLFVVAITLQLLRVLPVILSVLRRLPRATSLPRPPRSSRPRAAVPPLPCSSAARRNFPTLLSLFLLLVGIRVLFVIGVQVVNPLAQLWGPGPNSETMK